MSVSDTTLQGLERHPFEPFLPEGAKVLFLGSFPPQRKRWSMEFYYPNPQNDFWRIIGMVFFGDRDYFAAGEGRRGFDVLRVKSFCAERGIALYDTARCVRRLRDNASDAFLEIVEPTDVRELLGRIPECRAVVTTGEKASATLAAEFGCEIPAVGGAVPISIGQREISFRRMPSTSRAYPLPLERKAEAYRALFTAIGMA